MPRPMSGKNMEKSKNFSQAMKRLVQSLESWRILLVISLILAMISSILALIAPNKLSEFADTIGEGLFPNTVKLEEVVVKITDSFHLENIEEKMPIIMLDEEISKEDKDSFMNLLSSFSKEEKDSSDYSLLFQKIPSSILSTLLEEFQINGVNISVDDQIKMLHLTSSSQDLSTLDQLPESIYNLVKPEMDIEKVKNIALFMALLYIFSALFSYIQGFSMATISNHYAQSLRSKISNKINTLPLKYFDNHETGDVLSRVTNDVDTIAQNLNQSLASLVGALTLFIGSIVMMFVTSWALALTAILATVIGFFFMFLILAKSQKYFNARQKELGDMNGFIEEMYSGHSVVKAYNGTEKAIEDFEKLNERLYTANQKSQFLSGLMMPIMNFVGNLGYVAVCIVGALLTMNGYITFGVIVAFMIYVRLFTNPLSQIAQAMTSLQATGAASERVFEFLDEKEMASQDDIIKALDKEDVKGCIEFSHVQFGYDDTKDIIKDFSVKISPGEKVAIVGPTGAGKTTLVNLLMKFYEIKSGDILIDGTSIHDLSRENIHKLFCMVLQDTWLFDGTVKENIQFNNQNITEEDIWESCRVVGVDHFIKTLPGGLDAKISNDDTVSQGQKQLFTIARGMLEDAPFLILDEATSNVDTRTEELVQKAMDKLTEGKTSFIIAHRLSTIKNADLILVMKDGNIIEQGNHEELMKKEGFYADLYNSQFEL